VDLKKLSNFQLLRSADKAVEAEKKFTLIVLKHLEEIEKRKAFSELGYSSLYDYCRNKLKYSEMESAIRVNAMRLMRVDKRIEEKIESKELSLTTANKIHSFARKAKPQKRRLMKIVNESVGKSSRQVEAILDREKGNQPLIFKEKIIRLAPSPSRKLDKAKALIGDYSDAEIVEILVDQKLREPRRPELGSSSKFGRYISKELKDFVYKRARHCCEFEGCDEKRWLQIDHIVPIAKGGENTPENLRLLCANHNQYARVQSFGAKGFT
jgi:hypothetical protein